MAPTGYSGTTLAKKLGIKSNSRVRIVNEPANYYELFTDLPNELFHISDVNAPKDFVHYFTKDVKALLTDIGQLRSEIFPNGMIWISWPKKASKIATDVTEDVIRAIALKNGLVDIKVCAIDDTWSGLKLVVPVKERK